MGPVAPTAAEKEAKQKAKAERKNQLKAEREEQSKRSGSPVVMNPDGSYTSVGALAPETPYVTSQGDNQMSSSTGMSNPSLSQRVPSPASDGFKIPSKAIFDFALGAPTTSLSSKTSATSDLKLESRPTFGFTFGQSPISSLPQPPSADSFDPASTSTMVFDPMISPGARMLPFPAAGQPVNAPTSVEGPSLDDVLKIINTQGSETNSIEQIQATNLLFKPFDLGMKMRHCRDNSDELNKCITVMEAKESLSAKEIRKLEDEVFELQRRSRAAGNDKLKEAHSNIEARDRCIVELEHDLENFQAAARKVQDLQAEQLAAKDKEIAELKATYTTLENTNNKTVEKVEEDLGKKDRWIAELRRDLQDADDRYKASVVSQDAEKLKFKRKSEENEATMAEYRKVAQDKSEQCDDLRQKVKKAEVKAKMAEDHASTSDDKAVEQTNTIEKMKTDISGLHTTIQRLKNELRDCKEETKSMTLEKSTGSEDHRDCKTEIQRLESEKKEEIDKLHRHYTIKHAEHARHVQQEFVHVEEAQVGLCQELNKVRLRVQEDEHTINKLQEENRRLHSEVEDQEQKLATKLNATDKGPVEPDTEKGQFLSSLARDNELSEFSPALSRPGTPASSPGQWRPQTDSMMGDSADEGHHPDRLSYTGPVTVINIEPSEGPSDHGLATSQPVNYGLGIANVPCETHDSGTQTITHSPSPKHGLSKIATIVDYEPRSSELTVSNAMTVLNNTPSSTPKLSISKVSTIMDTKPKGPELSNSKPTSTANETPSSPPKLGISKPVTIVNSPPSLPIQLGFSTLKTVINVPPSAPGLGISKPTSPDHTTQSTAQKLESSKIVTVIDSAPSIPKPSISKHLVMIDNTPSNAIVIALPDKQPRPKSLSRWRWLWYLLTILAMVILILAASYGESARRERNMWLEANDFTRRAVYSVRAGGGTGMSVPAWLWNDQLIDLAEYYHR
ncbi:MAG: hypothetical protein LQ349_004537 [Xanthoria aureola]|nr:MAG: hypothetical protein LQ349_004537 [Xanthoria aureola]